MQTLKIILSNIVSEAFEKAGYNKKYGEVTVSDRPDLCQFQCNGALSAAKEYKMNPFTIAENVTAHLNTHTAFDEVSIARPGFINLKITDSFLVDFLNQMHTSENLGIPTPEKQLKIVVDYGGANVGKPLHVGHIRPAIIGESLKRIAKFVGHEVIGDVHLGDWGTQMGMIIVELKNKYPDWIYFDENYTGPYPEESPITITDFEEIYPIASKKAKEDASVLEACKQALVELHNGRPGYRALWQHFLTVSKASLKNDYDRLFTFFDLWLGESDVHDLIPEMVEYLNDGDYTYESENALVIDVSRPDDNFEIPPFMVKKSDGAALYSTTDLATIWQRYRDFKTDEIWYVVDNRQALHFNQVFRCAYKTNIVPENVKLEHLGFGTMNGTDGKPFKTRDGGVVKLNDIIEMVTSKASNRMNETNLNAELSQDEQNKISHLIGVSVLKYADLMNHRTKDYIFDLDRFSAFEGRTGPYLLYSTVRIKSIIRKARENNFSFDKILPPTSEVEKDLNLKLTEFSNVVLRAFADKSPSSICEYVYEVASLFNRFYHDHRILTESDAEKKSSWLSLLSLTENVLEISLNLLGIEVPDRM